MVHHLSLPSAMNSSTYALVASVGDAGVQIIDITEPSDPIAVSVAVDGSVMSMI